MYNVFVKVYLNIKILIFNNILLCDWFFLNLYQILKFVLVVLGIEKMLGCYILFFDFFVQVQYFYFNNIMMIMGSDFQYQNVYIWYKNLDKLIKYVN